jgi:uncharacterized membrane protein
MRKTILSLMLVLILGSGFLFTGCSKEFWGGAAAGAVGTGAAYELRQRQQMERLKEDRARGAITEEEYQSRKQQIEKGSLVY